MKLRMLAAALGAVGILLSGAAAWADGCPDDADATSAAYFRKGRAAEAARKWRDAYYYYQASVSCGTEEYRRAFQKLGRTLGARAEKEKHLGMDRGLFENRP